MPYRVSAHAKERLLERGCFKHAADATAWLLAELPTAVLLSGQYNNHQAWRINENLVAITSNGTVKTVLTLAQYYANVSAFSPVKPNTETLLEFVPRPTTTDTVPPPDYYEAKRERQRIESATAENRRKQLQSAGHAIDMARQEEKRRQMEQYLPKLQADAKHDSEQDLENNLAGWATRRERVMQLKRKYAEDVSAGLISYSALIEAYEPLYAECKRSV